MSAAALAPLGEAKARIHARLLADEGTGALADRVATLVDEEVPLLGGALRRRLVAGVLADVCGLGAIEPLLADPDVTEIMVNGPGRVWIERRGGVGRVPIHPRTPPIQHPNQKGGAPPRPPGGRPLPPVHAPPAPRSP